MRIHTRHLALLLLIACVGLVSCSRDRQDWEQARTANTPQAYQDFITKHPKSEFVTLAGASLDWLNTVAADSVEAYRAYLDKHPDGEHIKDASQYVADNLSFEQRAAIDLGLLFWYCTIRPQESEGVAFFGTDAMMVATSSGSASGRISLKGIQLEPAFRTRLTKHLASPCSLSVKDTVHKWSAVETQVNPGGFLSWHFDSLLTSRITILGGKVGFRDGRVFVADSTMAQVDSLRFTYLQGKWRRQS